ncbi:hypothetical protein DPMN_019985 [Dreissena polymorpha]|uniref:Uncharacterized protein n=1 Tax=Dreissena polymorpha TaxID=45954 RepID=A0A9D4NFZ6_DREPO|nr:hypothetical protein DPMN_019985 [Dreissena polymorpha]
MFTNCLQTDGRTDGRRTLSDHNSSPRAIAQADAGAPGLVMGPCIVEIDRIVIREVQYQLEVNLCRNEEIIVKDNFGWIDRIVIRECRNEEIIVKDNFGLAWPMWPGRPRVGNGAMHIEIDRIVIREAQYQFEVNQCRNEEVNFHGSSAYSDGRTDAHHHNIPTFSQKNHFQDMTTDGWKDGQTEGWKDEQTTPK